MTTYSFWKGFKKAALNVVLIGLPLIMQWLPAEWLNLTVGFVLSMLVNYIKVKLTAMAFSQ